MNHSLLKEYRCFCGKLLLKALVFQGLIEIKCRRCSTIMSWSQCEPKAYAMIECDASDSVVHVGGDVLEVFGCEPEEVLGRQAADIFPLIRDKDMREMKGTYEIPDNQLMLRDGEVRSLGSCIVPRVENGLPAGYRIYSVL